MPDPSAQLARPTTVHFEPSYFISESPWAATREKPRPIAMPLMRAMPALSSAGTLSLASHAPSVLVTTVGLLNVTVLDQLQAAPVVGSAQPAGASPVRFTSNRTTQTSTPRPA